MEIHGNGRTFRDRADLPEETRHAILDVFQQEMRKTITKVGGGDKVKPEHCWRAAVRTCGKVHTAALQAGWTPEAAKALSAVAGDECGIVLADFAERVWR